MLSGRGLENSVGGRTLRSTAAAHLDIFVDERHFEGGQHERYAKREGRPDPVQPDEPDERAHHRSRGAYGTASFCVDPPVGLLTTKTKGTRHHEGWAGRAKRANTSRVPAVNRAKLRAWD